MCLSLIVAYASVDIKCIYYLSIVVAGILYVIAQIKYKNLIERIKNLEKKKERGREE